MGVCVPPGDVPWRFELSLLSEEDVYGVYEDYDEKEKNENLNEDLNLK